MVRQSGPGLVAPQRVMFPPVPHLQRCHQAKHEREKGWGGIEPIAHPVGPFPPALRDNRIQLERSTPNELTISISDVVLSDEGEYTCSIFTMPVRTAKALVTVLGKPLVAAPPGPAPNLLLPQDVVRTSGQQFISATPASLPVNSSWLWLLTRLCTRGRLWVAARTQLTGGCISCLLFHQESPRNHKSSATSSPSMRRR